MSYLDRANALKDKLVAIRRDLHMHPELSFQEVRTAQRVAETLHDLGIEYETGVAKTGVVAYLGEGEPHFALVKIAAMMNGQVVNAAGIARDAGIARTTVQRYFDTLTDTLVGVWVPGWQPRAKVREAVRAKFYFIDAGAVRTLANRVRDTLTDWEKGPLLETFLLHEMRAAAAYLNVGGEICYWRTPAGVEIDFIWARGDKAVAVGVKSGFQWRSEYSRPLRRALEDKTISKGYGVYLGTRSLSEAKVQIYPVQDFLTQLWEGRILD